MSVNYLCRVREMNLN